MSDQETSQQRGGFVAAFLAMPNDRPLKTIVVAAVLVLVCSLAVSSAAVLLEPTQQRNKTLAVKKEILKVAGLLAEGRSIDELFQRVEKRIVDLATGEYVEAIDPATYDQRKAARDEELGVKLSRDEDIANIKRRARYAPVYLVRDGQDLELVIIPVHGYGLWSTMYAFLALGGDGRTIKGITFYDHAETAGLGSEVENPKWQALWVDKLAYDEAGETFIHLVKGSVDTSSPGARYEIDGLAGATLTGNGVSNLMRYWLGKHGFGPFLARVRAQEAS